MCKIKPEFALLAVALVLTMSTTAPAQDAPGPGYAQGAVGQVVLPKSNPYYHISPSLAGTGFPAITVAGGYFISPSLALEGELATTEVRRDQMFSYSWSMEYTAVVNVRSLTASLRWKPHGTSLVEFVVGGAWLASATRRAT